MLPTCALPDESCEWCCGRETTDVPDPDLAALRVTYDAGALEEADLAPTPLAQFRAWFDEAAASPAVVEPNAVVRRAPTGAGRAVGAHGAAQGPGRRWASASTPAWARARAATWPPTRGRRCCSRGCRCSGRCRCAGRSSRWAATRSGRTSPARPYGSRIGAWASEQSAPVADRSVLEEREAELRRRWPDTGSPDDVPLPDRWGGFLVRPGRGRAVAGPAVPAARPAVYVARGATGRLDVAEDWRVERRQP